MRRLSHTGTGQIAMVCQGCGLGFETESALRRHRNSPAASHACRRAADSGPTEPTGRYVPRKGRRPAVETRSDSALEAMWAEDSDAAGGQAFQPAVEVCLLCQCRDALECFFRNF